MLKCEPNMTQRIRSFGENIFAQVWKKKKKRERLEEKESVPHLGGAVKQALLASSEERAGWEIKRGKGEILTKRLRCKGQEEESYAAQWTSGSRGVGCGRRKRREE